MMDDLFETPAYKLVRRDDPSTSHDAAEQLDVNKMERVVLAAITSFAAMAVSLTMCCASFPAIATAQSLPDTSNSKRKA